AAERGKGNQQRAAWLASREHVRAWPLAKSAGELGMLPALKNGRGLLRSVFGFNQRTFGAFLFQRSALLRRISGGFTHRACPALGLATKERYTKTCALCPRSQKRSLTA